MIASQHIEIVFYHFEFSIFDYFWLSTRIIPLKSTCCKFFFQKACFSPRMLHISPYVSFSLFYPWKQGIVRKPENSNDKFVSHVDGSVEVSIYSCWVGTVLGRWPALTRYLPMSYQGTLTLVTSPRSANDHRGVNCNCYYQCTLLSKNIVALQSSVSLWLNVY